MTTSTAHKRFLPAIQNLEAAFQKVRNQKDKATALYKNKARDLLFQLECLCRLYRGGSGKKFFDTWYNEFKLLEDLFGQINLGESLWNEFSGYKPLKKAADKLLLPKYEASKQKLNQILVNDNWLNGTKLTEFKSGLEQLEWMSDDDDRCAFGNGMCDELEKLVSKYHKGQLDLAKIEKGLHEFRRRLRWLGMYALTSNGLVQLRKVLIAPDLKKYAVDEVVKSPFNNMPKAASGVAVIHIQSHYFYALNWLVSHLNKLKDVGIRHVTFKALIKEAGVKDKEMEQRFLATCACNPNDVAALAETAVDDFIHRDFITERICRDIRRSIS